MAQNNKRPLVILFITIFFDLVAFGIVIPILPIYAEDLGASGTLIGVIMGSFAFMQFFFAPFWGNLSDRIGRRPVLLASIALICASYVLLAFAHTLFLLLLSRMLAGIGAANISTAYAFISDMTPPERRAKNFGIVGAAFGMGFIFGPPLGGFLKDNFGMEWVGFASAGLAFLNIILAYFMLPESLEKKNPSARLMPNPFKEIQAILPQVKIRAHMLNYFIFLSGFSMMHITASLLWEQRYELSEAEIGYVYAFIGLSVALVQGLLIGPATKWFGEKALYVSGAIIMGVGLLAMPFVPVNQFIPWELVALLIIAVGNGFFNPTVSSLVSKTANKAEQGKMMGLMQSVGSLSRIAGPVLGGALYGIAVYMPYIVAAIMMAGVALLALAAINNIHSRQTKTAA